MPTVKVTPEELLRLLSSAQRVAHRTNSKLVIHWDRIEIKDGSHQSATSTNLHQTPSDTE